MNLSNFEAGIDDIILERGLDYFQNGRIEKVDEQEQNHYTIWIAGTSEYTVHVNLDAANEIVDSECDCPYDQGDYCKHQAAAFYMLRSKKIGDKHPAVHRQRDIKDILGELPKDELIHIISAIADQHEEIKKELLFLYAPEEDLTASSRKVIREFINREKRRGFIEWNRVDDALQGAFIVMEKAERELEQGKAEEAVLLALTVLPIIVDMQQYCDDSGGSAGYVIGDSLETLNKATASGELDEQQTKDLFQKILKEAQKKRYAGWSEWRNELLKACIPLCTAAALRKRLEKQIQKWLDVLNGDDQYDRERLMYLQLQLHERFDGEEKARAFLYAHIDLESFRERAIQQAIEKSDWTQIVNLCLEGESKDANYLITVNKWKKYRLFAYEKLGDMANQKQLLFDFLYAGDYDSYIKLKALYSPKEWHDVLEEILAAFEKESFYPSAYVEILKTEKRYAQLLNYCKRNPLSIEYLYPELVKDYPDDVSRLFVQWIEEEATYSANRPQYRSVCRKIKTYRKACGQSQALQVIKHLEQKYKNRPAFLDELEKVK